MNSFMCLAGLFWNGNGDPECGEEDYGAAFMCVTRKEAVYVDPGKGSGSETCWWISGCVGRFLSRNTHSHAQLTFEGKSHCAQRQHV